MEIVQQFNAELSSLYEVRPPISKAKMSQITRVSMKAVKMYKHIVQSVERFIVKCRPEYKIPGLYVIDSIVRQSRHQFGIDKDVYATRFSRNFLTTFQNLFLTCPPDDKPKIVRVLNLWQRNGVFSAETIQPLLDMANPNASLAQMKFETASPPNVTARETQRDNRESNPALKDTNLMLQLQQLANSLGLVKSGNSSAEQQQIDSQNTIKFNKKLLDFDYGDEEDEDERGETPTEAEPPLRSSGIVDDNNVANPLALSMAQNLLSNPELLQQLQQMQITIQQTELLKLSISELESHGLTEAINQSVLNQSSVASQQFLNAFQSQQNQTINEQINDENTKRNELISFENMEQKLNNNDNNNINANINNETNFQYLQNANTFGTQLRANDINFALNNSSIDGQQYHQQQQQFNPQYNQEVNERSGSQSPRSRSPRRSRFNRYRERSRSRNRRDRDRDSRRSYRSRSRSPRNSRFNDNRNDRSRSPQSYERERERERRRKGLPPLRKSCLTICSTTLWLGHVPKLVSEADLSDTFGEFGAINSIDLIPSRGCAYVCMNRRQDAAKALNNLRNMKLHGSLIKMAWAPGKGMKGKEYKDYWEAEHGASYIPYNKLPEEVDLDLLEEGGTVDDDTVPEKLQELRKRKNKEREDQEREATAALMARAALIPMPMVSIPNSSFGVTGLVMPPNMMLTQTGQTPVISLQSSSDASMLSTVTTTAFSQMPTSLISVANNDESILNKDRNEFNMNTDMSQMNESNEMSANTSGPLLPPPLPPFQAPLGMPPLPPILGGQPPPRMPWLSGPPPPLHPSNRMPVNSGVSHRPPLLPLSSSSTSTTNTSITSFRPEDIPPRPSLVKPEERPPLIATLPPLAIPHEELPPRLHPDRNFSSRDRFRPNLDRPELERPHPNDDPFAPSVYELRAMERNSLMRPQIPHQMQSGRSGLMQMHPNMSERFPFERPQRQYHPRHHNIRPDIRQDMRQDIRQDMRPEMRPDMRSDMRPDIRQDIRQDIRPDIRPDIRHHHNYDRHQNHGNHQQNRGSGRDQYSNRGSFNRRDRPSRWKSDDRPSYNRNNNNNSDYNNPPLNKFDTKQHQQQSDDNNESFNSNNSVNNNSINDSSIRETDNNIPNESEINANIENNETFNELETNT